LTWRLDAATGRELWRLKWGGGELSAPAVIDGVVYVGSDDGYIYAIAEG
jgi:outer membrane protein assembly factor BamB